MGYCCRIFTPVQPVYPAASLRDFLSGAYTKLSAIYDRSLKDQFDLARQELSFLPQEDQRWIFGETALTLWPMLR
jgi:hypothetical protein